MNKNLTTEDFEPKNLPEELSGLTAQILFDLFDIATKWGDAREDNMIGGTFDKGEDKFIIAAHPAPPGIPGIFISKKSKRLPGMFAPDAGTFIFETTGNVGILWDKKVSLREITEAISKIDSCFKGKGFVDLKTEKRVPLPGREIKPVRYKVSEVFSNPDHIFFVPPDIPQTPEEILERFDRPELLEIIRNGCCAFICLKIAVSQILKRRQTLQKLLAEKGLTERRRK